MDSVLKVGLRGMACVAMLVTLAACNGGDSAGNPAPSSTGNGLTPPTAPSGTNDPTDPSTPVDEPTQPTPAQPPVAEETNAAPQIAGSPSAEARVGQAFAFQPAASDADGDALTFSIASKPAWASFNASTGKLWGTPSAADIGSHEEIVISVSDGAHIKALPQFAVNVIAQANGSAVLAWEPPTQNTDGSALTNLKGYKIHYGTESGSYDQVITLNNAGLTRYVVEDLPAGLYYFAITAISNSGIESELSGEAAKQL